MWNGNMKKEKLNKVKVHLFFSQELKDTLSQMHQEFMDEQKLNITFSSFVQHLIEKGMDK